MTTFWRDQAACLDHPQELWFPVGNTGTAIIQTAVAKAICRRCPVIEACLTWALDTGESGVWGGLSEDERRALSKRVDRRLSQVVAKPTARDYAKPGRVALPSGQRAIR